jgi:hypothetical protein
MKKKNAAKLVLKKTTLQHLRGGDTGAELTGIATNCCPTPPLSYEKTCDKTCPNSCEVCIRTLPTVCGNPC